jgi:hypothetical protein
MLHRMAKEGNAAGAWDVGTSVLLDMLFDVLLLLLTIFLALLFAPVMFVQSLVGLCRWTLGPDPDVLPCARVEDGRWRLRLRPGLRARLAKTFVSGLATAGIAAFVYVMFVPNR